MSCNKAIYIKSKPVNVVWEIEEQFCVSFKDLTVAQLAGKYIVLSNAAGIRYKIWFDDGAATEPTATGTTTSLPVDIELAAGPGAIATAFKAALDGVAALNYDTEIQNSFEVIGVYGDVSKIPNVPEQGTAGALIEFTQGSIGGSIDMGLLDGDVTFDPTVETQDITAHQTGATILAQQYTSVGGTASITLKEYRPSRYKEIFQAIGGKAVGANVYGMGSAMIGKSNSVYAKRLVFKPVGAQDDSENLTIWKAVPELGALTFSGENPTTLPMEFTAFIDDAKDENINVWAYGDVSLLPA